MRILHIGTLYPPHIVGGAERSVGMLAETQVARGHHVEALCLSPDGWRHEQRGGVSVHRMPHENSFWMEDWARHSPREREWAKFRQMFNVAAERHVEAVLREVRPDIVNTHSMVDVSTLAWRAAKRAGVPIVHTLRDYDLVCAASSMYRETGPCRTRHLKCRVLTFAKRFHQRHVSAVTAVGREILERHVEMGYFDHVPPHLRRVIWNIAGDAAAEPARHQPEGCFTFAYLGRLSPEKGIDTLLAAARQLPPSGWRLLIAGKALGSDTALRTMAEGLPVEFLGFVEPARLFASTDVLVVPSLWAEPLGRSAIEAYRAGVPVIGSRAGGIAEIVDDPDWLFPPGDAAALAKLMRATLAGGRDRLPHSCRFGRVVARTTPDAVAGAFDALYAAVLRDPVNRPRAAVSAPMASARG